MELIDKEKSRQTKIAIPSMRSISTQKNASNIAMIEEKEDHIATISQCSQTEFPSDKDISFCSEEEIFSEEEEIESEN